MCRFQAGDVGHADLEIPGRRFYRSKGETREEGNLRWFTTNAEAAIQVVEHVGERMPALKQPVEPAVRRAG